MIAEQIPRSRAIIAAQASLGGAKMPDRFERRTGARRYATTRPLRGDQLGWRTEAGGAFVGLDPQNSELADEVAAD
jgi:hypothetical protein